MFFKQSGYKPRTLSTSSQGSADQQQDALKDENKKSSLEIAGPAVSAGAAGRRRSSANAGAYAGLNGHKRSSQDERKTSWNEQKTAPGILGGMWNTFTKGS
ncbi:hypothetical protein EDD37DRAFT_652049 [Exophiala viscosa]|uniref:Uncharacterized protein n=1 Tax=Exophiala viscosa TaxID=2486360 RepID=A0AAN6DVT0_9EURO|nr:hypothetical protein EDD36DRAFT_202168 [Exophiala viscosa]KAI1622795.1 hypothetical protein EDD37DRAFT_652049 [Exophiala viscosa]